jgi:glucose-6-phosphate 1-epimerase
MERKNKPSTIPISPSLPQPTVDVSGLTIHATLPSGDTVTINLFGATVTSWTVASGTEQLFLSSAAKLDGSKAIRGGIPIVFPVFGPPPKDHATSKLPQHGFARSVLWEFLGKNTSESKGGKRGGDEEVRLDFGLSSGMLPEEMKAKWPYEFGLVYSVTLGRGTLETGLHVQNKGGEAFEFQALFHNYLKIEVGATKSTVSLSVRWLGDVYG